ncbi:pentatricopeptide repeat-containing protein At4g21880, mitochondrial-like [Pistacia vera]|uniref:pentatricopeptide repeat-containing protein At4g21880, mitochondrial-like n=1 Tax=Pistacia vera TaxID=55513 RepID=UPI001263B53E|nr:pentatricopeptide repeat-containing protein At4g21880, mitochondrial-like [Pistacia vera]
MSTEVDAIDKIEEFLDEIFGARSTLSTSTLNSILIACEDEDVNELVQLCQVQRIYSVICLHNLKPNSETFRSMIRLCVRREDVIYVETLHGAYAMLGDVKKMNLMVTADMYNAIMAGYFRQKDTDGTLKVLKQMEKADVKPNSQTFSYLIQNCSNEKDIIKYYHGMTCFGVQVTKGVFKALINAYASCGEFEKAKQVILDKGIPVQSLHKIKGSLVATLASNGQLFDAFVIYEEIKQAGWRLEPKAIRALIEQLHSEEDLSRSIQLLEELGDPKDWISAIALLKQLNDYDDELAGDVLFREVFHLIEETEPPDLQFGLDLLRFIKNELHFALSYEWLRSLRSIFVKEKNIQISRLIWKEFVTTDYSYYSYLCMYEDLLISGDHQGAWKIISKIPKGDSDTNELINAIQEVGKAWRRLSLGSTQGPKGDELTPLLSHPEFGDFAGEIPHMP